jgi:hypothetical protein
MYLQKNPLRYLIALFMQNYKADCQHNEDADHAVALYCGVVQCLSEKL